jgi:hypothetical protein
MCVALYVDPGSSTAEFVEGAIDELGTVRDIMLAILVELNNARKTPSDSPGA